MKKRYNLPMEHPDMKKCIISHKPECISKNTGDDDVIDIVGVDLCLGKNCSGTAFLDECTNKCNIDNQLFSVCKASNPDDRECLKKYEDFKEECTDVCKYKACVYKNECEKDDETCKKDCKERVAYTTKNPIFSQKSTDPRDQCFDGCHDLFPYSWENDERQMCMNKCESVEGFKLFKTSGKKSRVWIFLLIAIVIFAIIMIYRKRSKY